MSPKPRTCFVPGCTSGYKSCATKASLFRPPKDAARREEWARNIKRADKELSDNCGVCERHFEDKFIERSWRHVIGGEVVEMPRDRPNLTDDAVPTLFPDAPKYFTKKAPVRRKIRNLCEQGAPPPKRKKTFTKSDAPAGDLEAVVQDAEEAGPQEVRSAAVLDNICGSLRLPGQGWNRLCLSAEPGIVLFGLCELEVHEMDRMLLPKLVQFKENKEHPGGVFCSLFLRGKLHLEWVVLSSREAQGALDSTHSLAMCVGCGLKPTNPSTCVNFAGAYYSVKCTLAVSESGQCIYCKCLRKLVQNQLSRKRKKGVSASRLKKHANVQRRLRIALKKLQNVEKELEAIRSANEQIGNEVFNARIRGLPSKQQMAVKACFKAAVRKSTSGMGYEKEWILECVLLRMKSPKLYEHLRKHNILILPSRTCLWRYLQKFKSGFGFNDNVFRALAVKTKQMDICSRHGGITFDEMKLSENFTVNTAGAVEGFVDLGKFTPEEATTAADHGMVMLFQPFQGDWTQVLGVVSSKGYVKAEILGKILLEAILLTEQAGLFVDFVTCDGATWNRSMWKSFGIHARSGRVTCKTAHPVDPTRSLHFCSDFPHLVKCLRNSFVSTGFTTPDGRACIEHIEGAWDRDRSSVTLKAMPSLTRAHIRPNSFEKMKVNLAFKLFSDEVLRGMFLYKSDLEYFSHCIEPTEKLVKRLSRIIFIMTSRQPRDGLRQSSQGVADLEAFLQFLDNWEMAAKKAGGGFVSSSTAEGLRVTIHSTLSLLNYVTSLGFKYLLTSRLSQDKLENLFGIIRQYSGSNDHPSPSQFLVTVNCLSFYNLARGSKSGNSQAEIVHSLLTSPSTTDDAVFSIRDIIEDMLEFGDVDGASGVLRSALRSDHSSYVVECSDSRLVYYMAGYVARKFRKNNACKECASCLTSSKAATVCNVSSTFTAHFDKGGLLYPCENLGKLVSVLEDAFTMFFSQEKLHAFSAHDFVTFLSSLKFNQVGCEKHSKELTAKIIQFFVVTRMHFYTKALNKERVAQRERKKHLKLRRCH